MSAHTSPIQRHTHWRIFIYLPLVVISSRAIRHAVKIIGKWPAMQHLFPLVKTGCCCQANRFHNQTVLFVWFGFLCVSWNFWRFCDARVLRSKIAGPCFGTDVRNTCRKRFVMICATITNPTRIHRTHFINNSRSCFSFRNQRLFYTQFIYRTVSRWTNTTLFFCFAVVCLFVNNRFVSFFLQRAYYSTSTSCCAQKSLHFLLVVNFRYFWPWSVLFL